MATQARTSSVAGTAVARWRQLLTHGVGQGGLALIDQAVVSGTRFLTTVVVGRVCGADALGSYALAFVFIVGFICVQDALVSTPYTVFSGRLRGRALRRFSGSVLLHYAILSLVAVCCLSSLGLALRFTANLSPLAPVLWILAGVMPFCLLREFARKFVFARLQLVAALKIDAFSAVVQLSGLIAMAYYGVLSPVTAFGVTGLGCAVSGVGWLYLARARFQPGLNYARTDWKQNWHFGKWLCATQLSGVLHSYIVEWCLLLMLGITAAGNYAACLTLVLMSNPFILGIANYMTPIAIRARLDEGNRGVRRVVWNASLLFAGVIGTYCLVLMLFGDRLLLLVFGEQFAESNVIPVLALCGLAWGQTAAMSCGLSAIECTNASFRAELVGLVTTMIAVPVMIAVWGSAGAAVGVLAGSVTSAALQTFAFSRLTR